MSSKFTTGINRKKISSGSIQFHNGITKTGKTWEWIKTGLEGNIGHSPGTVILKLACTALTKCCSDK